MTSFEVLLTAAAMFIVVLLLADSVGDFLFVVAMAVLSVIAAVWAFFGLCLESIKEKIWRQ